MAVSAPTRETSTTPGRRWNAGWSWTTSFFLLPAVLLLAVFLIYPAVYTIVLSLFEGRRGQFGGFLGLDNFINLFTADPRFLNLGTFPPSGALFNNVLWVIFYTALCVFGGLIIATLASRVRYEATIKAIVFLPMAIAATALGVIWRFMYAPSDNIGFVNALLGVANIDPVSWLGSPSTVNAALIAVGVWGSVGFATVILSAALKGIPTEILEAARTDGARESQIFWRIILPMVSLPISVVAVTLVVNVIKLFDLIYVMTGGGPSNSSRVIAFTMYQESLPNGRYGYGAAVAVVMLLLLLPVMIFNIRRFRSEAVI
ncbi:MAG: sugar ABC transporter permease [Chloroflexota bacterium]|nr:sugar ABC transporter permease [Chloroflexota bacterium]